MATDEVWGRNLRTAKRQYEERHDTRLTYKEIGRLVATQMGRDKPFGHSAVLNWFENGQEPETFHAVRAIAAILETSVEALVSRQSAVAPVTVDEVTERRIIAPAPDPDLGRAKAHKGAPIESGAAKGKRRRQA